VVDYGKSRAFPTSERYVKGVAMKSATRIAASTLGVYAGLLGMEHGYFETLQGSVAPSGITINAIQTRTCHIGDDSSIIRLPIILRELF
jgi:hypothetical protein